MRNCSTCERLESHRWCCVRERLKLAHNELTGIFFHKMEEIEAGFLNEFGVEVRFGADLYIDYQVYDCARWVDRYKEEKNAEVG